MASKQSTLGDAVDAITTIVDAVTQGAAEGSTEVVSGVVTGAYAALLTALKARFGGRVEAEAALEKQVAEPSSEVDLRSHVAELSPAARAELTPLADEVLRLVAESRASYSVRADRVQGLVQGSGNTVHMDFGTE